MERPPATGSCEDAHAGDDGGSAADTAPPEPEPREATRRRWLAIASTVLVLAVAAAVAVRTVSLAGVVGAIRRADPALLAAAVAVYAASWPVRGRRYGAILAPMDHRLGTGFLTMATVASQTANLVVPARAGDAARAYLLRDRRGVPYATGAASLAVERVFDLVAIGVLGTVATGWLVAAGEPAPLSAVAHRVVGAVDGEAATSVVPVTAAVGGAVVAGWFLATRTGLANSVPAGVRAGAADFAGDLVGIARRPRALARVGTGSVAVWGLDAATAVLVLAAVADAAAGSLLAAGTVAVCAGNLAKVLPLTQGGLGLYEGAFAAIAVTVSPVAGAAALAAAVLDHALKNGVTLAGGVVAGAWLSRGGAAAGEGTAPRAAQTDNSLGWPKK